MKNILLLSSLVSTLLLTACGGGSDSDDNNAVEPKPEPPKPAEYVPSQYKTLKDNFKYVQDPLTEVKNNNLYDLSYWVDENPLELSSYSYLYSKDDKTFKTQEYSTNKYSSQWREDPRSALVFNIAQNKWVETQGDMTVSQGPVGTEGIKTLYIQSDTGIKYYTLTEKTLEGLSLAQGINQGFGNGIPLPESVKNQYFTKGAKAYAWVQDITQPNYSINRTHMVFSSTNTPHPIYTCNTVSSYCSTTAPTFEKAIESKAWYQNTGRNGVIRLNDKQVADVAVFDKEQNKTLNYTIKYELIAAKQGAPKHILFTASDTAAKEALKTYFSANDSQIAWFEYGEKAQVVEGNYSLPIKGLQSTYYSYNKIAVNDILTKWSPRKNPVLE
ncbi:hypothetical protein ACFODO_19075 [Acinetobacter sichuanensis]|uniref:Lipoprotein n=1 Tax=Acinetobacter sichuanensis TaxID=2136183 RepID=A0A371YKI8_9GAMM|nr:hypothetical protein [Acinetobacter sichuanensis]RFC81971.1 hypothetical protein C9E89_018935 [Acinetobacter sichuanensis]